MSPRILLVCSDMVLIDTFRSRVQTRLNDAYVDVVEYDDDMYCFESSYDYIVVDDYGGHPDHARRHASWLEKALQDFPDTKAFVRANFKHQQAQCHTLRDQLNLVLSDFGFSQMLPEFIVSDWVCRRYNIR